MVLLEKVLVGFDGSHHARRACALATEVAGRFGSALTLVIVRTPKVPGLDPALEDLVPVTREGKAFVGVLEEIREKAIAAGASRCDTVYLVGDPLESLLDWLHHHPQDLVVVGSRGLSRGQRLLLGSISSGLVNRAPCPVLVVRGHPDAAPRGERTTSAGRSRDAPAPGAAGRTALGP